MFLVYRRKAGKEPDVRVSPRFRMLEEAIHDVRKLCQMKKVPEYEKKAEQLLDSVRCFYGKGKKQRSRNSQFMEADEQIKKRTGRRSGTAASGSRYTVLPVCSG